MIFSALLALAAASPLEDHPQTYLASVIGLPLKANEYVSGFSVDTWGVQFSAVCHIPPGWRITAGNSASPDGTLAGDASLGVTFLDTKRLAELRGLALITLVAPVQRQEIHSKTGVVPATFAGHANVGTYGEDGERKITISYKNVSLEPATHCPSPQH